MYGAGFLVLIIGALLYLLTRDILYIPLAIAVSLYCNTIPTARRGGAVSIREDGEKTNSKTWVDSLSLLDPRFNMREAAKQMILLEDHLFHENKHCLDCISKHTLFTEALLEEALTMDTEGLYAAEATPLLLKFKGLMPIFIKKMKDKTATEADFIETGNQLRQIRKPLAKKYSYFDI